MTNDEIIQIAKQAGMDYLQYLSPEAFEKVVVFSKLVAQHERERIKAANAPEIERINAHIKELEDAVLAEREACAKVCEEPGWNAANWCAKAIRARGQA